MSIYPVPLAKWFKRPKRKSLGYSECLMDYEIIRFLVDSAHCYGCGKRCKYNRAWGHHALPHGYGDVWCTKKCLRSHKVFKGRIRKKKQRNKKFRMWDKELKAYYQEKENEQSNDNSSRTPWVG